MAILSRSINAFTGTAVLGASLLVAAAASAQCTINPAPDFTQNDTGCPTTNSIPDTNGGCNSLVGGVPSFQATGTLTRANPSFTIGGSMGQDPVGGSRDIDWYSFTCAETCFVNISVVAVTPAGLPSTVTDIFFGNPADCNSFGGFIFTACPAVYAEQCVTAGEHGVVVTTEFAAGGGVVCDTQYTITVSARFSNEVTCGTPASGTCGVATPSIPGCQDTCCCDLICTADPTCCILGWDTPCATQAQQPAALGGCGIFVYNCGPVAGAPANDCATNREITTFNTVTNFDNTFATTDGPNNGQCGADTLKDVWFLVQANANGNMTLVCNAPTQDVVLSAYNYGSGSTIDGTQLANNFIGCVDNLGVGGETASIAGCTAGTWYLWRVGQWSADATGVAGAGNVTISLEQVVYDTGVHAAVCTPAGVATNLGLSSGAIAAGSPQRWLAAPFIAADPDGTGPLDSWRVTLLQPEGFVPAGAVNEKMNWILWRRNGILAPNYATDQLASGQIVYPTLGANGEANIPVDLLLPAGDYYLTVFPSAVGNPCRANDGQIVISNYAWFIGAPNGMALSDATGIFAWRGATFPGSGPATEVVIAGTTTPCSGTTGTANFVRYSGLNGAYQNCTAGGSLVPVYSPAFHILGTPAASNTCPTDLNADQITGSADLSILLNGWGSSSPDLNGDGIVGSADLSVMLNAWGACP